MIGLDRLKWPAHAAIGLLGLACTLPFLSPNFQAPIATFYGETTAFALGLLAIAGLIDKSMWADIRLPRAALMFLGFALLMALQIALGDAIYYQLNLLGALYVLWAAGLAMLANRLVALLGAPRLATILCAFLVAGTGVSAAIGLIQLFGISTPLSPFMLPQLHARIYANTGQPNHMASYLSIGVASLGYLWATRRVGAIAAAATCLAFLAVIATTGSRAVWLYVAAFIGFAFVMDRLRPAVEHRRLLQFSGAVFVGLLVAQAAMSGFAVETIGARVQTEGMSSHIRLRFWSEAWMMFQSAPIFGVGFKQFAWNNFLLTGTIPGSAPDEGIIDHSHNLIFQVAAEFGIFGLLVLLGGVAWWGWSLRRARIEPELWWMAAVLGVLGLHSMLEYPLWYAYFLGIAAMVMGAAECESPRIEGKSSGRLILCAVVLLGVFVFAEVFQDYRVMQSLQRADTRPPDAGPGGADQRIQAMLGLRRSSLFAPFIEFALARRMLLNQEHLEDKLAVNGHAMRFQPSDDFVYRQAFLLAMAGDVAGMRKQWDLAVANYPNDRVEALKVARALEQSGESRMKELVDYAQGSGSTDQPNGKTGK